MDALDREALDYVEPVDEDLESDIALAEAFDIVGKALVYDEDDREALGLTEAEYLECLETAEYTVKDDGCYLDHYVCTKCGGRHETCFCGDGCMGHECASFGTTACMEDC